MKIKYLGCDGETEAIEEVIQVELYEYENRRTGETVQAMECTRPEGDTFDVDCESVFYIKA